MRKGFIPLGWIVAAIVAAGIFGAGYYVATHGGFGAGKTTTTTYGAGYGPGGPHGTPGAGMNTQGLGNIPIDVIDQVNALPKENLSEDEIKAILEMREEEKLARDVYLTLYEKWGLPIFQNIARSEQTHTDAVKALIDKYGLDDPVKDDSVGVFTDLKFTNLYNQLVAEGSKSIEDALKVGATIEDLDIRDLEDWLSKTDNEDVRLVFCNLMKGSRNHLRAFISQLSRYGGSYAPQYISESEYEAILSGSIEMGPTDCQ